MAALQRPTVASYEVHENVRVDTLDNEDHTFCGVMFPIQAKADLPVSRLVINSVAVRGRLGPLTVWITNEDVPMNGEGYCVSSLQSVRNDATLWTKVYEKTHSPSSKKYETLDFSDNPIMLKPGQMKVMYIHSAAHHDLGIVYDNSQSMKSTRYSDCFLSIHSGAAHLSPEPFHSENIWGWGSAWREYREFVGRIDFGAVYQLWSPDLHTQFGNRFQDVTSTILACQRRPESPFAMLPDECIYYILNMCRWDWFEDTADKMVSDRQLAERKRQRKSDKSTRKSDKSTRGCPRSEPSEDVEERANRRWLSFNSIGNVREKIRSAFSP